MPNSDKFIREPQNKEHNQVPIFDATNDVWITGNTPVHNIDDHIDVPTKPTNGNKILEARDGNLAWVSSISVGTPRMMTFNFRNGDQGYHGSNSSNWNEILTFYYPGMSLFYPTQFTIVASRSSEHGTSYCRLYDLTNDNDVCSLYWSTCSKNFYTVSTLVNLPSEEALFEIQIKKGDCAGGWGTTRIHSCVLI